VLRQTIEKQLDRIEHVHRFTRAVSVGNPREFLQAEKEDQEMAAASCSMNTLPRSSKWSANLLPVSTKYRCLPGLNLHRSFHVVILSPSSFSFPGLGQVAQMILGKAAFLEAGRTASIAVLSSHAHAH
jgi:Tn3 transposase DDE domain